MANGRTKVETQQVKDLLKGGQFTIKDVASKFHVTPATARKHILRLTGEKIATKTGTRKLPDGDARSQPGHLHRQGVDPAVVPGVNPGFWKR
jgi:predicted ArsR family transcriptional regulator